MLLGEAFDFFNPYFNGPEVNINKLIQKLQSLFGITKGELTAVGIILLGLGLYSALSLFSYGRSAGGLQSENLRRVIDSLAAVEITSYTGSTVYGENLPELAAADTVLKRNGGIENTFAKKPPEQPLDLNKASKIELMKLPGVGEQTAVNIMKYRKKYRFARPEDLMNIRGIGEKKFEKIKQYVYVE